MLLSLCLFLPSVFIMVLCTVWCCSIICSAVVVWSFICCIYNCGWRWMFSQMTQNGIKWVCFCVSVQLVLQIMFCRYRCWFYVPSVVCDYSFCFGDAYFALSVLVVVIIFLLNHYSGPYFEEKQNSWNYLWPYSFLYCLFTNIVWCSSSLSVLIGGLSIIGIIPLTGQLNSNVVRLRRPCLSGVDLICSRAMCISLPESKHFFMVCFMNLMQASTCLLL